MEQVLPSTLELPGPAGVGDIERDRAVRMQKGQAAKAWQRRKILRMMGQEAQTFGRTGVTRLCPYCPYTRLPCKLCDTKDRINIANHILECGLGTCPTL
jgi:hypothetical protein